MGQTQSDILLPHEIVLTREKHHTVFKMQRQTFPWLNGATSNSMCVYLLYIFMSDCVDIHSRYMTQASWKEIGPRKSANFEHQRLDIRVSDENKNSIFICSVVFFVQHRWIELHTLTVDECYPSPSPAVFFTSIQRCVNTLQPQGIVMGQVSFISALEWNKYIFPERTAQNRKTTSVVWLGLLPFNVSEDFTNYDMRTDTFEFISPVKIHWICFTGNKRLADLSELLANSTLTSIHQQEGNAYNSQRSTFVKKGVFSAKSEALWFLGDAQSSESFCIFFDNSTLYCHIKKGWRS